MECNDIKKPSNETPERSSRHRRLRRIAWFVIFPLLLVFGAFYSGLVSRASAVAVARYARGIVFTVDSGRADRPAPVGAGPLDVRLGYSVLPEVIDRLEQRGFHVVAQARVSDRFRRVAELGLFPPYDEKTQAGLSLTGRNGSLISSSSFPASVYRSFEEIPGPVRETLLFLENRELLDERHPYGNPAIEWDRFVAAVANFAGARVLGGSKRFGASTLATQLEKLRHSPDGVTRSPGDKARQMASATLRSYRQGSLTTEVRRRILLDYLNVLPLGALPGYGEVIGLRDGLRLWFGIDPDSADKRLRSEVTGRSSVAAGRAYRAVMMLLLAQRRPSRYLYSAAGQKALAELTDTHLRLAGAEGVVSPTLARAAFASSVSLRSDPPRGRRVPYVERKAINAVRTRIADLVAVGGLYQLDRFDLAARTTIDSAGQREATLFLRALADRNFVRSAGLDAERLLGQEDPSPVKYGFILYERTPRGNLVRIQVDNLERPFDLNLGARLELGSTAKLRTLVTYLEIVASLHAELTGAAADSTAARTASDPITRWVRAVLLERGDIPVSDLLALAMERRYSASPAETFFTGGGVHRFTNFDSTHNRETPTVADGFRLSINLVFVRLMRDVVQYYEQRLPEYAPGILDDPEHPARRAVLQRFADVEGRVAIERAFRRHGSLPADSSLALLAGARATPRRYAMVLRAMAPGISADSLRAALRARFPDVSVTDVEMRAMERAVPSTLTLADRAFVTGIQPLELWVVSRLRATPRATIVQLQDDGAQARQDAQAWLFRRTSAVRRAQDRSIRITLERDAFQPILAAWRNVGYPYEDIVPSYGTSIGSSGDRAGALAELLGILIGDGIRRPPVSITELHFGKDTPYEVLLRRDTLPGHRVVAPEVAATALAALRDVVANGTATSVRDALPGTDWVIGGKTGTGDNVARTFGAGGRLVSSRTISRTATFVFALSDRFYGVATAYVEGAAADRYAFTSGLPVRVVRLLLPRLSLLKDSHAGAEVRGQR